MIKVIQQLEPSTFNNEVRIPGNLFLKRCPNPQKKDWDKNNYWKKINKELYSSYNGICAYTGVWFPRTVGNSSTVDHYIPKKIDPNLAYEWSNYRLATQKANNNKGDTIDIIDPFNVLPGMFILELPSCLIKAGNTDDPITIQKIENTIHILKLNSDDEYVQSRCDTIMELINGDISFDYLVRKSPFIASEIIRQNIQSELSKLFKKIG